MTLTLHDSLKSCSCCHSYFHSTFHFPHHQNAWIELFEFPPGTNTDSRADPPPVHPNPTPPAGVTWQLSDTEAAESGWTQEIEMWWAAKVHTINYPDITSPVMEGSVGKGQPSGLHKDQLTMHVTASASPACSLPTSHLGDMTNVSTRLLIALKRHSRAC